MELTLLAGCRVHVKLFSNARDDDHCFIKETTYECQKDGSIHLIELRDALSLDGACRVSPTTLDMRTILKGYAVD